MDNVTMTEEQQSNINDLARNMGYTEDEIRNMKPMSYDDADRGNANALYDDNVEYKRNCQTCTPAMEARFRGLPITANGYLTGGFAEELSNDMSLAYIDPQTKLPPVTRKLNSAEEVKSFLENEMAKNGRYEFGFDRWKTEEEGHIITIISHKGSKFLVDAQDRHGAWFTIDDIVKDIDYTDKVEILRVDKLLFSPKITELFVMN